MEKLCKRCGEFNRHRKSGGSFICYCWECEKDQCRQSHHERKTYIVESLGNKCSSCGIRDHPCIYDAHHVDQNSKIYHCSKISDPEKLIKELKKCKLLCVRCHRLTKHETEINRENQVWKKCQKCSHEYWHTIRRRHPSLDTTDKRRNKNSENQKKMLQNWKLGQKIHEKHASRKWSFTEWNLYCQDNFNFSNRNANDYERLFNEFSVDALPSSLNGVRTGKHSSNLVNEEDINYIHNICLKCLGDKRKSRKEKMKNQAITYKGGKCYACESIVESEAFDFHHIDSSTKKFKISDNYTFNENLKTELDKCVLLCCYCHRKVHSGVLSVIDPLTF